MDGRVVVLTGASSGIARRAALAYARRGASVVLAARDEHSLEEAARECRAAGARALAIPTDVADEAQVQALARRSHETFKRIDVWVNAAAVIIYGEFEHTPSEVYRRVLETNLFGQINGARAVLPFFRDQKRGVLINIASVWGSVTSPYVSAYVVSKFGVRAFSECLQEALRLEPDNKDIHVCTILPQSVDTPIFRHAGNYTGRAAKPVPPVLDPDRVVRAILESADHPRRRRTVGVWGRLLELVHAVVLGLYSTLVPTAMNLGALGDDHEDPNPGNVFEPMPEWNQVEGGWRGNRSAVAGVLAAATAGAAGLAVAGRRSSRGGPGRAAGVSRVVHAVLGAAGAKGRGGARRLLRRSA